MTPKNSPADKSHSSAMDSNSVTIEQVIHFAHVIGKLKNIQRTGWIRYSSIKSSESVAEHVFRLAVLALCIPLPSEVSRIKLVQMALVHDLGEAIIGDVVTNRGAQELPNLHHKQLEEEQALKSILHEVGQARYAALFTDFVQQNSTEARFLKQLDKMEMAVQALEYEQTYGADLTEFFDSFEHVAHDTFFQNLSIKLKAMRPRLQQV